MKEICTKIGSGATPKGGKDAYIDDGITFLSDLKILVKTVKKVLEKSDVVQEGTSTCYDFGECLLRAGKIERSIYELKQTEAKKMLEMKG